MNSCCGYLGPSEGAWDSQAMDRKKEMPKAESDHEGKEVCRVGEYEEVCRKLASI